VKWTVDLCRIDACRDTRVNWQSPGEEPPGTKSMGTRARQRTLTYLGMLVIFLNCAGYSNTRIALQARDHEA
jgi:hypothetical protein